MKPMDHHSPSRIQQHAQILILSALAVCTPTAALAQIATIPAGVPLRVEIDHRYPMKAGTQVEGHLIAPVFLVDHEVLPVNTPVSGVIVTTHPVDKSRRADAILNGDFTPLAVPEIRFDRLTLPNGGGVAEIATQVIERDGSIVRMKSGKRHSLIQQAKDQLKQRKQDALDQVTKPGKSDRLLQILYAQLPYHPQCIWPGTQYDAELTAPLLIPHEGPPVPLPVKALDEKSLIGTLEARLTEDLSSATAKQGEVVDAVLMKPLLDSTESQVLLPQGTHLEGVVLQAKPARRFARNGKLRFTFRRVELPSSVEGQPASGGPVLQSPSQPSAGHQIHGRMIASEANRQQNVVIDSEGGAQATGGRDKYVAPLVLGLLAASASGGDKDNDDVVKNGAVSNGFGLVVRIATMASTNRSVAQGLAYFALAKSIYKRWIAKGSEISFPKNTRLQIELSER